MPPDVSTELEQMPIDASEIERKILNRNSPNVQKMQRYKLNKDNIHATVISSDEFKSAQLEANGKKVQECRLNQPPDLNFELD